MKYKETTEREEKIAFFSDKTAIVCKQSPLTGKFHKTMLMMSKNQYDDWKVRRRLIQDALPQLDNEEREFLMTGYTPEDWGKMFPPEEDEES